ncbi:transcriptional regulator [Pseudomonas sp. Fl4BN1]|uniref:transcriptional regulator n=1 Tax=Pseudomonas sp. Fl4BN1 TaxID=2697651 RepID=UPI001378CFF2|nr:YdaS family helix-turn-helix protein [Pseudomonas sp. Fl4BN1]NBF13059.1 helix-turn-helix domain-containing protein [Pseudomonas sp. Fl4BN1]
MLLRIYVDELPRGGRKLLALQLGVSASYLARLVSGDRSITAERALQIERATLGIVSRYELRPDLQWEAPKRGRSVSSADPAPTLNETLRPNPALGQSGDPAVQASSTEVA